MKTLKPTFDQLVCLPANETMTSSGIHLPNAIENQTPVCRVIAIGPDVTCCKPNDDVLLFGCANVFIDGKHYLLAKQADVAAILEETE